MAAKNNRKKGIVTRFDGVSDLTESTVTLSLTDVGEPDRPVRLIISSEEYRTIILALRRGEKARRRALRKGVSA